MIALVAASLLMASLPEQERPKRPPVPLRAGLTITRSCKIAPGPYLIAGGADEKDAAIKIRGKNITVDLTGVTLYGTPKIVDPDQRAGFGISIQGENITIRGGAIRGYKTAIIARNSPKLKIVGCNLSHNWKQRLKSTPEREDAVDWMSYHKNEADEWLRFGAGLYMRDCDRFEIKGIRIEGGQCGVMMTNCNKGLVWNNDFNFLSAVGLGMYRSSDNRVLHNNIDYCVRGYSHGIYNRGQDSTGILIYEQSNRNVFAYNSATHGGDGFFLWAGQTTMDTGQGGCNDNILYGNDFSSSPANAIEATFSRNIFANNLLVDSWHGVWGGYSFDTQIVGNVFGLNGESIAIEHGQNNVIEGNTFDADTVSVFLWQNAGAPDPNWGYPKHKDTSNKDSSVLGNVIGQSYGIADVGVLLGTGENINVAGNNMAKNALPLRFEGKHLEIRIRNNTIDGEYKQPNPDGVIWQNNAITGRALTAPKALITRGGNSLRNQDEVVAAILPRLRAEWERHVFEDPNQLSIQNARKDAYREHVVKPMKNGKNPFGAAGPAMREAPRNAMIIDEWGPYDFASPKLALRSKPAGTSGGPRRYKFEVLGPKGDWKVVKTEGGRAVRQSGRIGEIFEFDAEFEAYSLYVEMEYVGAKVVDYRGIETKTGKPFKFAWSEFSVPIVWEVKWFAYDKASQEPRTQLDAFEKLLEAGVPIKTDRVMELNYAWGGELGPSLASNHFATVAVGSTTLPKGTYILNVTSDDGVRVFIDGKKVLENWTWHGPTLDTATLELGGKHQIRVEHFEIDGYATLKVELAPKR